MEENQNTEETAEDAARRFATENIELTERVRSLELKVKDLTDRLTSQSRVMLRQNERLQMVESREIQVKTQLLSLLHSAESASKILSEVTSAVRSYRQSQAISETPKGLPLSEIKRLSVEGCICEVQINGDVGIRTGNRACPVHYPGIKLTAAEINHLTAKGCTCRILPTENGPERVTNPECHLHKTLEGCTCTVERVEGTETIIRVDPDCPHVPKHIRGKM